MVPEIILTGADTLMRSSIAVKRKVCVPPPGSPGASDAFTVHIRQALQKIERADAIEKLQSHRAQTPQAFARTSVSMLYLFAAVIVTEHVIGEDNVTLLGKVDTARRNRTTRNVLKAAAAPMSVWTQQCRETAPICLSDDRGYLS